MNNGHDHGDGKWVVGLAADTPTSRAARKALKARLESAAAALAPAADWGADPEPVHGLRVTTRRAGAALDAFADLLPGKAYRKARKALKGLRRAAGAARDADVFLDTLRVWAVHQSPAARPGLHFLLGHAFARRQTAQVILENALANTPAENWADLPRKVHGAHETLGERAGPVVSGLLRDLELAARGNLDDYEQLHRVRIAGKRLRYALELFIDCFPAAARERVYPRVEALQDILGLANDSYQAGVRLDALTGTVRATHSGLWELTRTGLEELRAYHQRRLKEQRAGFAEWWRQWELLRPAEALGLVRSMASSGPAEPVAPPPGEPAVRS